MVKLSTYDVVVFDLDDTLYSEKDYVLSGYKHVSQLLLDTYGINAEAEFLNCYFIGKKDTFDYIIKKFRLPQCVKEHLIAAYRYHRPEISLHDTVKETLEGLEQLNIPTYLITDGRSITQRLKIASLGLAKYFKQIYISEEVGASKPELKSFVSISSFEPNAKIVYVADNPKKDFIAPKALGWASIGLLNSSSRVHPLTDNYQDAADVWLASFANLRI
ncbi:HAD family hydrolase [Thalassotalea ponticola]|uniref:HAD family hydrolase n=1 Tax=Thalassotalea ponticola TaxID=1523392 RepID=UPI0025B2EADE|nr:HAD family hydrolase [Thalassotalea ponticola]MDN3652660.1 HAD family hydrolase [Thalassotalea ponticola]